MEYSLDGVTNATFSFGHEHTHVDGTVAMALRLGIPGRNKYSYGVKIVVPGLGDKYFC